MLDQPFSIHGEDRGHPNCVVDRQPDEASKQQAVLCLTEQVFGANAVDHLQQDGVQQLLLPPGVIKPTRLRSPIGSGPQHGDTVRRSCSSIYEAIEPFPYLRFAQLSQCLGFQLADALARQAKLVANFIQRVVGLEPYAKAHAQDSCLARL